MKTPVRWVCSYESCDDDCHALGLDSPCENIEAGRIHLIDADGDVVARCWADYAGDLGLEMSVDTARAIERAINSNPEMVAAAELYLLQHSARRERRLRRAIAAAKGEA